MKKISFAIIGGGPAAFYTAKLLFKMVCDPIVHIFEQQLCPFGLLRFGVAPDHISIKKSQITLSQIRHYQPSFQMIGNMAIKSNQLQNLREQYSGIIHAYGASGNFNPGWQFLHKDNTTQFARKIVYWYNNHPSMQNKHLQLHNINKVTIIGNGNVAIDIARVMLRKSSQLESTEISETALADLRNNGIKTVSIVGRRGLTYSAFSLKQLRQIKNYEIQLYAIKEELQASMNESSYFECTALGNHFSSIIRMNRRKLDFIKGKVKIIPISQLEQIYRRDEKKIIIRYLLTPENYNGSEIIFHRMKLEGEPFYQQARIIQNQSICIPTDFLIISTGFQVEPLNTTIHLNSKKILHSNGCLVNIDGSIDIGHYAVGWCKNGAKGVIDETLLSCEQTFNNIRLHCDNGLLKQKAIPEWHHCQNKVNFQQYLQLRDLELSRGNKEKFIRKKLNKREIQQFYGINSEQG